MSKIKLSPAMKATFALFCVQIAGKDNISWQWSNTMDALKSRGLIDFAIGTGNSTTLDVRRGYNFRAYIDANNLTSVQS